jgi:hypothetical protein
MPIDRLFIDGKECDLLEGTVIALTFQINDLAEMKDRQANFSNQFKIPMTANNREIIEDAHLVQSTSVKPYRKLPARLSKNGVDVIAAGVAFLESSTEFYNVTVYSGIIDFFDKIKDLRLSDLDTTSIDPIVSTEVALGPTGQQNPLSDFDLVVDTRANTWAQGWKYPIIDHGRFPTGTRDIFNMWLRPAAFIKSLVNLIHSEQGWNYEWSGKTSAFYESLLLPYADTAVEITDASLFNVWNVDENLYWEVTPFGRMWLTPKKYHKWRVRIKGDYIVNWSNVANQIIVELFENVTPLTPNFTFTGALIGASSFETGWIEYMSLVDGNKLIPNVKVVYAGGATMNVHLNNVILEAFNDTTGENYRVHMQEGKYNTLANYNAQMLINQKSNSLSWFFKSLKQTDLIKSIFQMFGIVSKADSASNTMYWSQFSEIAANKPFAKNWTAKLHPDKKTWVLEYRRGKYGQFNWMKYAKDDNVVNFFSDDSFPIDDELLEREVNLFQLPFGATNMITTLNGLDVAEIKRITSSTGGPYDIDVLPRILIDDTQNITGTGIKYQIGFVGSVTKTTDIPLCYFYLPSKPYDLTFSYLKKEFYTELIDSLDKDKKFTGLFNLTEIDIAELDHFIPVYLEQFSSYFYINKIPTYTGSRNINKGLTKVELIRI